jgi:hypothetical protein
MMALRRLAGKAFNLGRQGVTAVAREGLNPTYLMGDVLGGTMSALMTPGDIGDKAIVGISDFAGSAFTGGAVRQLPGLRGRNNLVTMGADMGAGMFGGGILGYGIGENIVRARHGGLTPAEQMQTQEVNNLRSQVQEETLQGLKAGMFDNQLGAPYLQVL